MIDVASGVRFQKWRTKKNICPNGVYKLAAARSVASKKRGAALQRRRE